MATGANVSATITEIAALADAILKTIETTVPAAAGGAAIADGTILLLADLASKAVAAWSAASGVEITADSVLALLPNQTPLTEPTA